MLNPIIFIMGVSGSGKTTIGQLLSQQTGIPFFDADDFHPPANIQKMNAGQPLDDDDRRDWLLSLNSLARQEMKKAGAVIACSALKAKYRTMLTDGVETKIYWIYLRGNFETISQRLQTRKGHFMPASLLQSQFETLEPPDEAIVVDITHSPELIVERLIRQIS